MDNCKGCGKEIVWGKTIEGKNIPLDPRAPTYEATYDGKCYKRSDAMVSHFATCPKANDFSKKK